MTRFPARLAACGCWLFFLATVGGAPLRAVAAELPDSATVKPTQLLTVDHYCEGVVFDRHGAGYISHGKVIVKFALDGKHAVWAETGAPNGHKILADGTHLVCDASRHAVLHLSADGKMMEPASKECDGKPLRGPNDLCLDTPGGGFYFTDPGGSDIKNPIGTVHYVDKSGKTHLLDGGYAYSNGIVLTPDGRRLYVAESQRNRVMVYDVTAPGKVRTKKVFANLPKRDMGAGQIDNQPDGMCLDAEGNLYVAHYGMKQVQVLSPNGELIARYDGGNVTTSNVAFGGSKLDQLFVTGGLGKEAGEGGLFRLDLGVKGLRVLPDAAKKSAHERNTDDFGLFLPGEIRWQDAPPSLPAGAKIALLEGDPAKEGPFVIRFRFPDGYRVMPHVHPKRERVTIISGVLNIGMGEKFDAHATRAMPPGTFGFWEAGMKHFAWVKGETVLQLHGMGPWEVRYLDPADDPRNAKK